MRSFYHSASKQVVSRIIGLPSKGQTQGSVAALEGRTLIIGHLQADQNLAKGRAMVEIVKQTDISMAAQV